MEKAIQILIYFHAAFGGIALLAGLLAIIAKKGKTLHRKAGLVFFYSMMLSGITALVIAVLPNHESPFLFAVGIFSLYFVFTGNRALKFKRKDPVLTLDKWIAVIMIATGSLMILLPVLLTKNIDVVLFVFAIVGITFSIKDLRLYKNPKRLRKMWLKLHLGKMLGGYISATTAFVVVNKFFPSIYGWFIPGIIGSFMIAYWQRKINKKKSSISF
ncbi:MULTISPECIES: DUF2306 domain-containing protein [Mesonia]|uniref:Uncharacterized protein n=1 Tax=Mesonia oceanica TaxID=2687242 RepID=A0AC61YD15_9FLAO|nr:MULTISPECIES: DUF2306 domain-containing protein [Mesonia]MAN26432.1 DUF2306 domain-containing protein [Mesonia sp.]MAQ39572.1 DUF2306 domain-containing protein [Mesonia sp.]MBJ99161.1 DUF2306 domain-containing protein [Flavobacteriaceae bacterium]VVV02407.1 hypothetical protein FVB9532_03706 [Mesonia oceanica]|tara:strand:- start:7200 stop:7844 length:645 start_codon:yes stop_codon:yes gene_type:complete